MIKIAHTADIHLGEFNGPTKNGVNLRKLDILKAYNEFLDKCLLEDVDMILIAGDFFDKSKLWASTMLELIEDAATILTRSGQIARTVLMIGTPNHDSLEAFNTLKGFGIHNVTIATEPRIYDFEVKGETVSIATMPAINKNTFRESIQGLSFEEENLKISELVGDVVKGLSVQCKGHYKILMSHFTVTGCSTESGHIFSKGDIVLPIEAIEMSSFDLIALGHIHRAQQLPLMAPTFYSGNLQGLTFNEEGLEKGFYIHEFSNLKLSNSVFHEVNARQFLTIKLEEPETINFINTNEFPYVGVKDAIVRVLFTCSAEVEKQLSKVKLESALYKAGAFYVTEIRAVDIFEEVNRTGINDKTIMDNLVEFLAMPELNLSQEKQEELRLLALPVVEVMEASENKEKVFGTFSPLRIAVENYRSYKSESFDLSRVRNAIVNGANGIGKSSFFMDAIIDCLYENPREGDLTGWIDIDESVRSGMIEFEFQLGDRIYKVTRTRTKSGKATLGLFVKDAEEWKSLTADKMKDTQERIEKLLGMDCNTFKVCALIMQDQYGLILEASKTDRMKILLNVLGLDVYEKLEDKMSDLRLEQKRLSLQLKAELESVGDVDAEITEAEESLKTSEEYILYQKSLIEVKEDKLLAAEKIKSDISDISNELHKLQLTIDNYRAEYRAKEVALKLANESIEGIKELFEHQDEITSKAKAYETAIAELSKYEPYKEMKEKLLRQLCDVNYKKAKIVSTLKAKDEKSVTLGIQIETIQKSVPIDIDDKIKNTEATIEANKRIYREYLELESQKVDLKNKLKIKSMEKDNTLKNLVVAIGEKEKKISLMDDCNCIDITKANCKFLADAKQAKIDIIGLNEEYELLSNTIDNTYQCQIDEICDKQLKLGMIEYMDHKAEGKAIIELDNLKKSKLESDSLVAYKELYSDLGLEIATLNDELEATGKEVEGLEEQIKQIDISIGKGAEYQQIVNDTFIYVEKRDQLLSSIKEREFIEAKVKSIGEELEELKVKGKDVQLEIDKVNQRRNLILVDHPEIDFEISTIKNQIKAINNEINESSVALGGLKSRLQLLLDKKVAFAEKIALQQKYAVLEDKYEQLQRAFSQDGIPYQIIRTVTNELKAKSNSILTKMTGGKMLIDIELEKTLKSNKKEIATMEISIIDYEKGSKPYLSHSGGERVRAALAFNLGLAYLMSSNVGIKIGMLFIDEPPFLDSEGIQAYCDALDILSHDYPDKAILAISHDQEMKARFSQEIMVYKTEQGSKAVMM